MHINASRSAHTKVSIVFCSITTNGNYGHSSKEMNFSATSSPKKAAANGDDIFLMLSATTLATINTSGKTSDATMIAGILPFSSTKQ